MRLSYNGVDMQLIRTENVTRIPVRSPDNIDRLYDQVTFEVTAVLNPGVFPGVDPGRKGSLAFNTELAIRERLSEPRKALVWYADGNPGEQSYASPFGSEADGTLVGTVDSNGGPIPEVLSITKVVGLKTWLIHFKVTTFVNECEGTDSALISNRYTQVHTIDPVQFRTVIASYGQAFFLTDALEDIGARPDDFRFRILPPIPFGFARGPIEFVHHSASNSITWRVVDTETMFDLGESDPRAGGSGVTHVDAVYSAGSMSAGEGIAATTGIAQCDIEIVGSKLSSTWVLIQKALQLAAIKLPVGNAARGLCHHLNIQQSMTDRRVKLSIGYLTYPGKDQVAPAIPPAISDALRIDQPFQAQGGVNPLPMNDGGTRGTYRGVAITPAIRAACEPVVCEGPIRLSAPVGGQVCGQYQGPPPAVVFSTATILPPTPTRYDPSSFIQSYSHYDINIKYPKIMNRYFAPKATTSPGVPSPGGGPAPPVPTIAVMQLGGAFSQKIVEFKGTRIDAIPAVPNPNPQDPNLTLLYSDVQTSAPPVGPDGTTGLYTIQGRYEYVMGYPYGAGDNLGTGVLPYLDFVFQQNAITAADYETGLIDSADGTATLGDPGTTTGTGGVPGQSGGGSQPGPPGQSGGGTSF